MRSPAAPKSLTAENAEKIQSKKLGVLRAEGRR